MSVWFTEISVDNLNEINSETMAQLIGIEYTEIGDDYIKARMPIDGRTSQPMGILHGGASLTLAETLGSVSGYLCVDPAKNFCVGMEINANHIRPVSEGYVYGVSKPIHLGKSSQVWEIRITDDGGKLVCISRITLAVLPHIWDDRDRS